MTTTKAPSRTPREAPSAGERLPSRDNVIKNRHGEVITLRNFSSEDRFAFDTSIVPDGWTYEWKTLTVKGAEWTEHQVELYQNGWTPVPADRHDGIFMPRGAKGNIVRGGLILMERDDRLTAQARREDRRLANEQLGVSRSMAGLMGRSMPGGSGILDFEHPAAQHASGVRVDRQARMPDQNYKYEVEE